MSKAGKSRAIPKSGFIATMSLCTTEKSLALKRFKDDVKEVSAGFECGVSIQNYNDIKVDDVFEAYKMEQIVD